MEMSKVALVIWLVCIGLTHELAVWALWPFLIILVPKLFLQTQPLALVKGMGVLFCFVFKIFNLLQRCWRKLPC